MKTSRIARLMAASIPFFAATLWACSGGSESTNSTESNATEGDLEIHFPKSYSAFAPGHEFKVPVDVDGVKSVKWSTSDESIAEVEKQSDGSGMVTVRKAGTVDIIAKAGSLSGRAQLVITAATAEEWEAGNQRYNNGVVLKRGEGKNREAGAPPSNDPARKQASCTNCHSGASAGNESADVEHTPMQTAGYTDAQLIDIFTKGTKPAGVAQRVMMSKERWKKIHQWEMDEFAVKGIVVYLRSLEPKSQGETDFGGWGRGKGDGKDGKGGGRGDGTGSGTGTGTGTGTGQ